MFYLKLFLAGFHKIVNLVKQSWKFIREMLKIHDGEVLRRYFKISIYSQCIMRCIQCLIQMYFGTVWTVWVTKKVLVTRFLYIFHVKPKWNIVYEYLKTKIFSNDPNILPQMHWTSNIFWHSAAIIGGYLLSNP